ncbi:MAG: GFA family protein [Alphaproteobacteria bacterium]|nr:GFA family protein [Alphaproteobacteria bacterium]
MGNSHTTLTGQCLCGSVQYRIDGPVGKPHACHCGQYLRQSGHYAVSSDVQRAEFSIIQDRGLKWYDSSSFAKRGFCKECGSALFWDDGQDKIYISIGSLDQPTGLQLASHIFVNEKADYYEIEDELPKFAGYDTPLDKT